MKKTLLAVAMMAFTTCAFAQVNGLSPNATNDKMALSKKTADRALVQKGNKSFLKTVPSGATLLCDFSDPSAYTFGTMPNHEQSGARGTFCLKADSNSNFGNNPYLNDFSGVDSRGWTFRFGKMSVWNGFAYYNMLDVWYVDHQQNNVINAYVKFNTPINTYGMTGLDIYISESMRKFNSDRYYIDWSADPTFATYDSIEFNIKNVDVATNEGIFDVIRVNIPSGMTENDPNDIIGTEASPLRYIRIRLYSPASVSDDNPQGYWFAIDDIAYQEAPASRIDIKNPYYYNGGYAQIPQIVSDVDNLVLVATVANTGADSVSNVYLNSEVNKGNVVTGGSSTGQDTVIFGNAIANIVSDTVGMSNVPHLVIDTNTAGVETGRYYTSNNTMQTKHGSLVNDGVGPYRLLNHLFYTPLNTTTETMQDVLFSGSEGANHTNYNVVSASTTLAEKTNNPAVERYRWARDCGTTNNFFAFQMGIGASGLVEDVLPSSTQAGYRVCSGYTTTAADGNVHIKGVEIVPAFDSVNAASPKCEAGVRIKSKLMKMDNEATTWPDLVTSVVDANDNEIESKVYTVTENDLNKNNNVISNGYYNALDDYNTIYLPFKDGSIAMEQNVTYYACYELVSNGNFAIAATIPYINIFGSGSYYDLTIFSPEAEGTQYSYPWGRMLHPLTVGNSVPMIRMIVGSDTNPDTLATSGIENVNAQAASMGMYPNPASKVTTLSYTLNNSGNVVINVTDVMGRSVMTMDRGSEKAGMLKNVDIDVTNLSNGTYFCTLTVNGAKTTSKFVVNK